MDADVQVLAVLVNQVIKDDIEELTVDFGAEKNLSPFTKPFKSEVNLNLAVFYFFTPSLVVIRYCSRHL